jgi:hypothetical protein
VIVLNIFLELSSLLPAHLSEISPSNLLTSSNYRFMFTLFFTHVFSSSSLNFHP